MLDGHDGSAGGAGPLVDAHNLLLSLAGLIDDELLGWSRELVAVGECDYALELVTAAIVAHHIRLPEPVHAALLQARGSRGGLELPTPMPAPRMTHRFLAEPAAAGYPGTSWGAPLEALHRLPGRLLRGCRVWLSWRLTPAGSAPAPVPHPVLLVETIDGSGADLLAYQAADLLWREGVFASVEVFGPDTRVSEYHRAALEASIALDGVGGSGGSEGARPAGSAPSAGPPAAAPSGAGAPAAPGLPTNGLTSTGLPQHGDPTQTSPRGNLPARDPGPRESDPRPPMRPVDRIIAARASAPHKPIDRATPFERAPQDRPAQDRPAPERPSPERPAPGGPDRGGYEGFDMRDERPVRDPGPDTRPTRDQRWSPGRPPGPPPPLTERRPADRRGPERNGTGAPRGGPGGERNGVGGPAGTPPAAPPPSVQPTLAAPTTRQPPTPQPPRTQQSPPGQMPPGQGQVPPGQVPPGQMPPGQMPRGQVPPSQPPRGQVPPAAPPGRSPRRPDDPAELPDGLSDVEQRLLRQLHEELAAREDSGLPTADQPPQRMFRNGAGRPPPRPGPPG